MATSGGQPGNQNASKGKPLTDALRRALARAGEGDMSVGMNKVAERVLHAALAGEQWAAREVWDRLEGKPKEEMEFSGSLSLTGFLEGLPIVARGGSDKKVD